MSKHHNENRKYRIYGLTLDDQCFVGKTTSPRMTGVFSRHTTGSVAATRDVMDQEKPPTLHILESLECTGAEAYRHVLAWIHLLESEGGYYSVNHEGTLAASDDLYPQTEAIYQSLPKEPVEEILARTRLEKPSDGNLKPEKPGLFQKPERKVQMNLWISPQDKRDFRQFCKKHKLRSRDAMGLLLDQAAGNDVHLRQIQAEHKKDLTKLRREYQKQLSSKAEERAADFLAFLRPGLGIYLRWIRPDGEPLPSMPYKRFRKENSDISLEYPAEEGFVLLDVQIVLWGHHRAKFIVGRGENGEYLQLRYYQRPLYVGLEVNTTRLWYIGCRKASDGAMEIAAAFPVPPMPESPQSEPEPQAPKPGLEDLIRSAQSRKIP